MTQGPTDPQDQHDPAGEPQAAAPRPGEPGAEGAEGLEDRVEEGDAARSQDGEATPVEEPSTSAADGADDTARQLAERTLDLQRLQAEYVNYKRRVDRDRTLVQQNAVFSVLSNLLPVLDDIDRAREHGELEGGFKAVAESLEKLVAAQGLEKYGAPGDEFDPNLHEALMHGLSPDVTTTTVDVVAQAGYRIGERVVRAAKVTVLDPEE